MNEPFKKIHIEISNICNLQCSFCPAVERTKKMMSTDVFRKTVRQAVPWTDEICLHLMGEPLAHPHFAEILKICDEEGARINLTTNGTLLNRYAFEVLWLSCVKQINFSIHSFQDNFKDRDIRPYLDSLLVFASESLKARPDLYINFRLWNLQDPQNFNEANSSMIQIIEDFFKVDLNLALDVRFKKNKKVSGRIYLNFDTKFEWPSLSRPVRSEKGFCYGLSSHIGIHADGTVVPCCLDKEASIPLGKITETDLTMILSSERAKKIRKGFKNHQLVEPLCQRCSFIERFDQKVLRSGY